MNTAVIALILGLVQGLSEFFPVSSSGHLALFSQLFSVKMPDELLFDVCLHIGTVIAVIAVFRKDILRILSALYGMTRDVLYNAAEYFRCIGMPEKAVYRKILSGNYRQLTVMLFFSCIPTGIMGFFLEAAAQKASHSLLMPGMGFLITGVVLLVVDKVAVRNLVPREVPLRNALLIGLAQGVAVMPGISRSGITICASLLCGMNRKMAVRYSFLLSVPTMIGALIFEIGAGYAVSGNVMTTLGYGLLGGAAAGLTAYFTIRRMLKIVRRKKLYYFSYYCFAVGIAAMAGYFKLAGG